MTVAYLLAMLDILRQENPFLFLLADLSIKSSVILIIALPLGYLLRKQPAADRSALWMVVIAALLLLPFFNHFLPGLPVALTIEDSAKATQVVASMREFASGITAANSFLNFALHWIAPAYATVGILLALYLTMGIARVVLLSRAASPWRDPIATAILKRLQDTNGITCEVELLLCRRCASPLTWGIRRHKILLPASAREWNQVLLEQIMSHELAHIQRNDWLCFILSRLAICLYWVNPLAWHVHNNLIMDSEKACDNAAIEDTGCPFNYAENLLHLAAILNVECKTVAPTLFGRRSSLVPRIRSILDTEESRRHGERSCLISGLIITAVLVAPFSALNFSIRIIEDVVADGFVISVNYIPRDSIEYQRFRLELESF